MTGAEMAVNAAINAIARMAGYTPEMMRKYIHDGAAMLNSFGERFMRLENKTDTIILQNKAISATLATMQGKGLNADLHDDALLMLSVAQREEVVKTEAA